MNKVVCNVCGTSYPENAAQCPICGYVQTPESTLTNASANSTYTYVKGGRFSKANVKKRNKSSTKSGSVAAPTRDTGAKRQKSNIGSIAIIVLLLVAIIAVICYIALRFFIPNSFLFEGLDSFNKPADVPPVVTYEPATEQTVPTEPSTEAPTVSLDCSAITLNASDVQLDGIGNSFELEVTLEPQGTTDTVTYSSSDNSIAIVSDNGTITAVGSGTATITVSCGSVSSVCVVECIDASSVIFTLNRKEINFNNEDESWLLYDGEIPVEEIIWTSDDNQVATIEAGKVTAVGDGTTSVHGVYKDQAVTCVIHCEFGEESDLNSGDISEAGGDSNKTYQLFNPYGYADDVTINPGEVFILRLVDENLKDADGAVWKVDDENICSFNNSEVKAVASGTTQITATCAGKTYTCTVRVN